MSERPPDRSLASRPFAVLRTEDQWRRASHDETSLQPGVWAVQLAWEHEPQEDAEPSLAPVAAGLAFDPWCRLYHSVPEEGRVERLLWAESDPLEPLRPGAPPEDLFAAPPAPAMGDFVPAVPAATAFADPRGLAVDDGGRLFVAEAGEARVLVYDLLDRRLLRRVGFAGARPLDLAAELVPQGGPRGGNTGERVWALLADPPGLAVLDARTGPKLLELPAAIEEATRLAARPGCPQPGCPQPGGSLFLLTGAGDADARVVPVAEPAAGFDVPFATDLEFLDATQLVVARLPGDDFLRFSLRAASQDLLPQLKGRGYDGRGIVRTPDGRIGFWTDRGFRHAVGARLRYRKSGRVVTYRLDSGRFQTVWGRVFLDACIPGGTEVRLHCAAADEPPEGPTLARTPPSNSLAADIHRPDLSPPMPPLSLVPEPGEKLPQRLHRRESGRELPWAEPEPEDPFETYEAPVLAPPGRYLWVTLELSGDTRRTPRVKAVRVENPSHDLLRRLPRLYSRETAAADFLRRYLALAEGSLADLDARSFARRALLDPYSAPPELLSWLASFVGLVLDERWSEEVRRRLIAEAVWLFRFRGTVAGLRRFLEIVLGRQVVIAEHFRFRGLGGAVVGGATGRPLGGIEGGKHLPSRAVLGAGFRVGGSIGSEEEIGVFAGKALGSDGFATHAHRFSVVIPAALESEEMDMVRHLLDEHRPAHTLYDICTVDAGMRVGIGLYVALTTLVGRSGGFGQLQVGGTALGRTAVLGRPGPGTRAGSSRLGADSRIG